MSSSTAPRFNTPGVRFNEGFFFGGPPHKGKHPRASLALNLSRLNPTLNIALADRVLAKMDPVQPAPPAPAVPPAIPGLAAETAVYKAARDKANASNDAYEQAKVALALLNQQRDADSDDLRVEQTSFAKLIEAKAKGDPVMLTASGFPLAADATQSTGAPGPIFNFNVTQGDNPGTLDGSHDRPDHTVSFDVEVTTVDPVAGPYVLKLSPTKSAWQLTGLTSAQRVCARIISPSLCLGVAGKAPRLS